jgi:folylpolyglutamate synthase/dihydropteroate synthase
MPDACLVIASFLCFYLFPYLSCRRGNLRTHVGGEYDATNVVVPVVTGITALEMDHVRALGPSTEILHGTMLV